MRRRVYGIIEHVEEGSPAWDAGIKPGDELVAINAHPVRDLLDYQYLCLEDDIEVEVKRGDELIIFEIDRDEDEDLGLEFADELFDGLRSCRNNCIFCFLQQMPKGLRKTLYVRDDDYRLSLAQGNYITLTNVDDEELQRIRDQRMSPLYISVHTTEPELRECMLRTECAGRIMEQLRFLAEGRITMHTQIVLCPGVNDGEHLERSVRDLASLHPWVTTVGVVPVGLTRYRERLTDLHAVDPTEASEIVDKCLQWQREFRRTLGTRFVYPSDEFYLLAGRDFPSGGAYEGFPQMENGIGISRIFLDELKRIERTIDSRRLRTGKYVIITGTLSAVLLERLATVMNMVDGVSARVSPVVNKFLGESVTVTGLLSGQDVSERVSQTSGDETVLIPDIMLNEDRFLDDVTMDDLTARFGNRVIAVPTSPAGVFRLLKA